MGANYDSIDQISGRVISLDSELTTGIMSSDGQGDRSYLYLIHSSSATDVRLYGEAVAKHCKEECALFSSFFFRRIFNVFPADGKRLAATLAYQICVSSVCPQELKVEILGTLHAEPDIPEQSLENQLQKLIVRPLINAALHLPPTSPVIFVLDSVHDCERVEHILENLSRALRNLNEQGVNAKAVFTSLSYQRALTPMQQESIKPATCDLPIPLSNKSSLFDRIRSRTFFLFDRKYNLPEIAQRVVEAGVAMGLWAAVPFCVYFSTLSICLIVGLGPFAFLVAGGAALFTVIAQAVTVSLGVTILMYRELARYMWPRST